MQSLEPNQLKLMRIHALIRAAILVAIALGGEAIIADNSALPFGLVFGPLLPVLVWVTIIAPGRRYRAWSYSFDADELQLARGIMTRTHSIVPIERVQHIDVAQGPIERSLGLSRLIVHTAGTAHSRVVLPGLSEARAHEMRDEIRARIVRDAE